MILLLVSAGTSLAQKTGLSPRDFRADLTKGILRNSGTVLGKGVFKKKLKQSLKSPMMLMRSYPSAFYADLRQVSPDRLIGGTGLAFGDAHPENFGFIHIDGKSKFVFNDLDDSGRAPVAFDAARYFTILQLMYKDDALTTRVIDQYVRTIADPRAAVVPPARSEPDWGKVRDHDLQSMVSGDRFAYKNASLALTQIEDDGRRSQIRDAVVGHPAFAKLKIVDIAEQARDHGGSGGLTRYWLLVDGDGGRTVLELKQAAQPAVEELESIDEPSMKSRLSLLKQGFWGSDPSSNFIYVKVGDDRFLARDRLSMKGVDITALEPRERDQLLLAQASYMATVHSIAWRGVSNTEMTSWLQHTTQTLATRWMSTYKDLR